MYLLSLWNEADWFSRTWVIAGALLVIGSIVASAKDSNSDGSEVGICCLIAMFLPVVLALVACAIVVELFQLIVVFVLVIIPELLFILFKKSGL